jgi:hypothetical protein
MNAQRGPTIRCEGLCEPQALADRKAFGREARVCVCALGEEAASPRSLARRKGDFYGSCVRVLIVWGLAAGFVCGLIGLSIPIHHTVTGGTLLGAILDTAVVALLWRRRRQLRQRSR